MPDDVLASVPVPDVSKVPRVPLQVALNGELRARAKSGDASAFVAWLERDDNGKRLAALPMRTQVSNVPTRFVAIDAMLDTSALSDEQRLLLEVLLEAQFEVGWRADGNEPAVGQSDVVQMLSKELISHANGIGFSSRNFVCGAFGRMLHVSLRCGATDSEYARAVYMLHGVLTRAEYDAERITIGTPLVRPDASFYSHIQIAQQSQSCPSRSAPRRARDRRCAARPLRAGSFRAWPARITAPRFWASKRRHLPSSSRWTAPSWSSSSTSCARRWRRRS